MKIVDVNYLDIILQINTSNNNKNNNGYYYYYHYYYHLYNSNYHYYHHCLGILTRIAITGS